MFEGLFQPIHCLVMLVLIGLGILTLLAVVQLARRMLGSSEQDRRIAELAAEIGRLRADLDARLPRLPEGQPPGGGPPKAG